MNKDTSILNDIDQLSYNTIRALSLDAIDQANSGHPGLPLGMAPYTYQLWSRHLKHSPKNPSWINRDRFILSAGHGSMLLYSILHLFGYGLSIEEIRNFRQLDSKTPGHPESHETEGVEITTGPLGQGISNAVGMAIAEKYLEDQFNTESDKIIDYKIYVLAGDGCLQEGVSAEACSLAGHLKLDNLIVVYDDNNITIDGDTSKSFTEDVALRYQSYGWEVIVVDGDGHNFSAFEDALNRAKKSDKPVLIKAKTVIGFGSKKKQGTAGAHGSPFGTEESASTKEFLGLSSSEPFFVDSKVKENFEKLSSNANDGYDKWLEALESYAASNSAKSALLKNPVKEWDFDAIQSGLDFKDGGSEATRAASGKVLNSVMPNLPFVLGGSADLTGSNNTFFDGAEDNSPENRGGRYIRYGVREHAMGAILNGISRNELLRAYGGTFLCFSDYMRPSIRLAALSSYPSIFVFTHDSIGLGEDGPTHQPVEHLAALRSIPNLNVIRPADGNETVEAWKTMLSDASKPHAIILSRQKLKSLDRGIFPVSDSSKGGYILADAEGYQATILASGSEVEIALEAKEELAKQNVSVRVVSMPCLEIFDQQSKEYRSKVIDQSKPILAVEAGVQQGWDKYLGFEGVFVGMDGFGISAPYKDAYEKFGITAKNIANKILGMI